MLCQVYNANLNLDGAVKSCWPMACLYRSLRFVKNICLSPRCWWIKPDITYPWLLLGRFLCWSYS